MTKGLIGVGSFSLCHRPCVDNSVMLDAAYIQLLWSLCKYASRMVRADRGRRLPVGRSGWTGDTYCPLDAKTSCLFLGIRRTPCTFAMATWTLSIVCQLVRTGRSWEIPKRCGVAQLHIDYLFFRRTTLFMLDNRVFLVRVAISFCDPDVLLFVQHRCA